MNSPIFSSPGSRLYVTVNWIARSLTIAFAALLVIAWWDETRARQASQLVLSRTQTGSTTGQFLRMFFQHCVQSQC